MMGTFFSINIALKGMMAAQTALSVTSNNIANANTDGYTRQRVEMLESHAISGSPPGIRLGSGVDVGDVNRIRDEFVDHQLRTQTSSLQYDKDIATTLGNVETVLNESADNTGLSSQLDSFWNAWQEVASTPESSAARTTLKETAVSLTDTIRNLSSQFSTIQNDIQMQINQTIENVDTIARGIARLNAQILTTKTNEGTPNDLLDARDLLLDELAGLGNVTVTNHKDAQNNYTGAIVVTLGNETIVDENGAHNLSGPGVIVTDGALAALNHLGGNGNSADTLQYYIDKMDTLALGIAESVNTIHKTGIDLQEIPGKDFFVFKDTDGSIITDPNDFTSGNMYVNPDIDRDVSQIAASKKADGLFLEGNGDIALEIANLKVTLLDPATLTKPIVGTGVISINSFYANMVNELGSRINETGTNIVRQQTLVDNLTIKRDSLSGVSLDEETANTVLYQHAFNACAKIINVMDQMLNTIINNMKA